MSKKSRANYTSKGERKNVNKWTIKSAKKERSSIELMTMKLNAFNNGKKIYLTVPNPNTKETNKKFIRIDAAHYWTKTGDFRMGSGSSRE